MEAVKLNNNCNFSQTNAGYHTTSLEELMWSGQTLIGCRSPGVCVCGCRSYSEASDYLVQVMSWLLIRTWWDSEICRRWLISQRGRGSETSA